MNGEMLRESVTDAMKFWEPLRVVYNGALTVIVVVYFLADYPHSKSLLTLDALFFLFLLAVMANVVYCLAYVADLFAQVSEFREVWRKFRWILFAIGLAFAAILTRFFTLGLLHHPGR